ncbi:Serine/threonine-protein kinase BRSK2 [Trichinella pseudospiralis]|uniref:non-specific serine/threonine protein kinase n=1 Tax=Trichinella pseudospiralis TaxID=6337 RepID=A0A0V1G0B3_TRIPS|nr:Serine/threonine-protein kinase BRSK2 [Trichinella pseudospiralis]
MVSMTNTVNNIPSRDIYQFVGPYRLEKTLGKGQTGLVKLGTHYASGRKVAIKIVRKEKLSESVLIKVEREIAVMKLIDHPYILRLYDVYENQKFLYLILEYVSGGELFDYLVRKGRLPIKEAKKIFRQIVYALDYCHAQNIWDLKPENLLLDERNNIKIADFGMASLQVEGSMLETSCGSPHYACPEVIRGEKYDGKKADVWSCGVILYALLVGALPFDDDNLRHLLEKVKRGVFHIPHFVPPDCQSLLRGMIEVNVAKRMSLDDVFRHPWVTGGSKCAFQRVAPLFKMVQTLVIPTESDIDPDVLRHMTSLGCFGDRSSLIEQLLNNKHNAEKVIYFVLLDRKMKRPVSEDDDPNCLKLVKSNADPPRKRMDFSRNVYCISDGSPANHSADFRRTSGNEIYLPASPIAMPRGRQHSRENMFLAPRNFAKSRGKVVSKPNEFFSNENIQNSPTDRTIVLPSTFSSSMVDQNWRMRLQNLKASFTGSPHLSTSIKPSSEDSVVLETADLVKRSWFDNLTKSRSEMEKEDELYLPIQGASLNSVKTILTRAFLTINGLSHTVTGPSLFSVHLRNCGKTKLLSRTVKIDVNFFNHLFLVSVMKTGELDNSNNGESQFIIKFTLIAGSRQKFCRFVDHISAVVKSFNKFCSDMEIPCLVKPRRLFGSSVSSFDSNEYLFE